jgi:hypothetical protein
MIKSIKSVLNSAAFWVFFGMPVAAISISIITHDKANQYTGKVISVSSWDGTAELLTQTCNGKDTVLTVKPNRYESFVLNQTITVWTGGDLFDGIASTKPQH